jgi:hypothetical protein
VIDRLLAAGSDLLLISVFQILEQVSTVVRMAVHRIGLLCCDNIHSGGFLLLLLFYIMKFWRDHRFAALRRDRDTGTPCATRHNAAIIAIAKLRHNMRSV